jgi:hypothetical protein
VRPLRDLPDLPQNAGLLAFLRGQASPPSGPDDYALGAWQLHTHPDLIARLGDLAPGWPLTAACGVPMLASQGIAAVVALGTDWLAVRIDHLPAGIKTQAPAPEWTFADSAWHIVDPWQSQLPKAEGTDVLRRLVRRALRCAASLAGGPQDRPRSHRRQ